MMSVGSGGGCVWVGLKAKKKPKYLRKVEDMVVGERSKARDIPPDVHMLAVDLTLLSIKKTMRIREADLKRTSHPFLIDFCSPIVPSFPALNTAAFYSFPIRRRRNSTALHKLGRDGAGCV